MKKVNLIFSLIFIITIVLSQGVEAQTRKPWSPQAKGTVIGAGTGAAAGAIIHKRNRVVGGVVGGVAGGATGYAIGKHKDNKNKEAARVAAANRAAANRAAEARTASARSKETKKETVVANTPAQKVTANGLQPTAGTMAYNANNLAPGLGSAYLPNNHYGDTSKPYHTSELRRKSW